MCCWELKTNSINNESFFFDEFEKLLTEIELKKYFRRLPGIQSSSNSDILTELKAQGYKAIASALEVLRNRIDEFGVSEPNIQRSGKSRIIVELAGVKDIQRAADLIQKTALTFLAIAIKIFLYYYQHKESLPRFMRP